MADGSHKTKHSNQNMPQMSVILGEVKMAKEFLELLIWPSRLTDFFVWDLLTHAFALKKVPCHDLDSNPGSHNSKPSALPLSYLMSLSEC